MTYIWPQLDNGAWKPELLTADEYCFHHESILPEVTERWDMEHRGLINFTESDFFNGYSCKYCPEDFYDRTELETHKKGKHLQNHYCHHCQIEFENRREPTDSINEKHLDDHGELLCSSITQGVPVNEVLEDSDNFHDVKCLRCEEEAYVDIMAVGQVNEESLNCLDRGLAKRLEFTCNLLIQCLTDIDIPPAAKTLIFTPGARTVLKTKATPSVLWAPKTSW